MPRRIAHLLGYLDVAETSVIACFVQAFTSDGFVERLDRLIAYCPVPKSIERDRLPATRRPLSRLPAISSSRAAVSMRSARASLSHLFQLVLVRSG